MIQSLSQESGIMLATVEAHAVYTIRAQLSRTTATNVRQSGPVLRCFQKLGAQYREAVLDHSTFWCFFAGP